MTFATPPFQIIGPPEEGVLGLWATLWQGQRC